MLKKMLCLIQRFLLPNYCSICQLKSDSDLDLCSACKHLLPLIEDRCYRCGVRFKTDENVSICCVSCLKSPPPFFRLCAVFDYSPPVTELLTSLKFGSKLAIGRLMGEIFANKVLYDWYKNDALPEAIIPVPLHARRIKQRGYNQVIEFLRPLKKQDKMPILLDACQRIKYSKPQTLIDKDLRFYNVQNIFAINKKAKTMLNNLSHVAIVDDVVTTGNTVKSLASLLLKETNIERIDILCLCRG